MRRPGAASLTEPGRAGVLRAVAGPSAYTMDPVKGSRFVATVAPVSTESDALAVVDDVRATWPDASHHCWAFRLVGGRARASDDGEPGGSAGRPILARIEGQQLEGVVVVVTRWFGGTKLGVGGLMRAYGGCAGKALDVAEIVEHARTRALSLIHDYNDTAAVLAVFAAHALSPEDTTYDARVRVQVLVPEDDGDAVVTALNNATSGRATARWLD